MTTTHRVDKTLLIARFLELEHTSAGARWFLTAAVMRMNGDGVARVSRADASALGFSRRQYDNALAELADLADALPWLELERRQRAAPKITINLKFFPTIVLDHSDPRNVQILDHCDPRTPEAPLAHSDPRRSELGSQRSKNRPSILAHSDPSSDLILDHSDPRSSSSAHILDHSDPSPYVRGSASAAASWKEDISGGGTHARGAELADATLDESDTSVDVVEAVVQSFRSIGELLAPGDGATIVKILRNRGLSDDDDLAAYVNQRVMTWGKRDRPPKLAHMLEWLPQDVSDYLRHRPARRSAPSAKPTRTSYDDDPLFLDD